MACCDRACREWSPLGDSAWFWRGEAPGALAWYDHLRKHPIPHMLDVVLSFDTVAVHFDPEHGPEVRASLLANAPILAMDAGDAGAGTAGETTVPVCYGGEFGPDLEVCARELGRTCDDVVSLHSGVSYKVAAIGFSPGFPYLSGLPKELALPRKPTPQPVAAGTVAMAGEQSGIYPVASPGGWHRLGRTSLTLFSPHRNPPSLLMPGDRIRFQPVRHHVTSSDPARKIQVSPGTIEVISPGTLTTVQDLGRLGHRHVGVCSSGCADPRAAAVLNHLVGNPAMAALLECAASGPVIRFLRPATAAWFGWRTGAGRPCHFMPGDILDLASVVMTASRGFIAISGGIEVPLVLGSRSTDLRAGMGGHHGRALVAGDCLSLGTPNRRSATAAAGQPSWFVSWRAGRIGCGSGRLAMPVGTLTIRFLRGIDWEGFPESAKRSWCDEEFRITAKGNRTGLRLAGTLLATTREQALLRSQPVVAGSVQVPPDGVPVVLLGECQTIGGYPQLAHIISADLAVIATSLPGCRIRFREITLDEARQAWLEAGREVSVLCHGTDLQWSSAGKPMRSSMHPVV